MKKGDRQFRVWPGPFSGKIWAGWMRYDGERWVAENVKHDVTADVMAIAIGETCAG